MSSWYKTSATNGDIVVSTRIRLARNLSGLPFPIRMSENERKDLNERVKVAIKESDNELLKSLKFINVSDIPHIELMAMVERHIISPEFANSKNERAIILSEDENISIMVGEEDHIRIQVISGGLELKKCYEIAEEIDNILCEKLNFAFDDDLGFLTECPTNLGTGLRASVMLHLPITEASGKIPQLADNISKIGFTVRGIYGEGSKSVASMYQLSNQITLGMDENGLMENLINILNRLIDTENEYRKNLDKLATEDSCFRALGILQNSRILSSEEMMNLISRIKLGIDMGIINTEVSPTKMFIEGQPYMLMRKYGSLEPRDRDIYRAKLIREEFK